MAKKSNVNPCSGGPCFTGPRDHRFCAGYVVVSGIHFRCNCKCGHPVPPKDAWPGHRTHRVLNDDGEVVDRRTFKPCP